MIEIKSGRVAKSFAEVLAQVKSTLGFLALLLLVAEIALLTAATQLPEDQRKIPVYVCLFLIVATFLVFIFLLLFRPESLLEEKGRTEAVSVAPPNSPNSEASTVHFFISAPMASLDDKEYEKVRLSIMEFMSHLREVFPDQQNIYFAGEHCPTRKDFDAPQVAIDADWKHLIASRQFVLIYPKTVPSSCLVEAGFSLALGLPSVYFVHKEAELPFMLREAGQYYFDVNKYVYDEEDGPLKLLDRHRQQLFGSGKKGENL